MCVNGLTPRCNGPGARVARAPAAERGVIRTKDMSLDSHIAEFREIVDAIYGTYLDACEGFGHVRAHAVEIGEDVQRSYEGFKTTHPELAHLPLGEAEFAYSRWVPANSEPRERHLHQVPLEVLRRRNEQDGSNFRFIGNVCAVTLFQYWEDHFREQLAHDLGIEKNALQVPLFGELRRYRQAILHNRGFATTEVEECQLLKGPRRGEPIRFDRNLFENIVDGVLKVLHDLRERPEQFIRSA